MFTGIIQEIGRVREIGHRGDNLMLEFTAPKSALRLEIGASIAINGACQTVVALDRDTFRIEAVAETLSRTNLGALKAGSPVNLETPLSLNDLIHGHLVQGHVDCVSRIIEIRQLDGSALFAFNYPREYEYLLIEKGSVAIDGVSFTIMQVDAAGFWVSIIPHTLENTIFIERKEGDSVNLEFDMIGKYIRKMMSADSKRESKITIDYLKEHGF